MREDGAFIEAGENDNLIVQKLEANPHASASSATASSTRTSTSCRAARSTASSRPSRPSPTASTRSSRSLYIYVKNAHVGVIPGIREYIAEFTSDAAIGDDGYLADKGLIPLPEDQREQVRAAAKAADARCPCRSASGPARPGRRRLRTREDP